MVITAAHNLNLCCDPAFLCLGYCAKLSFREYCSRSGGSKPGLENAKAGLPAETQAAILCPLRHIGSL
jgi:hypothetical protein